MFGFSKKEKELKRMREEINSQLQKKVDFAFSYISENTVLSVGSLSGSDKNQIIQRTVQQLTGNFGVDWNEYDFTCSILNCLIIWYAERGEQQSVMFAISASQIWFSEEESNMTAAVYKHQFGLFSELISQINS